MVLGDWTVRQDASKMDVMLISSGIAEGHEKCVVHLGSKITPWNHATYASPSFTAKFHNDTSSRAPGLPFRAGSP